MTDARTVLSRRLHRRRDSSARFLLERNRPHFVHDSLGFIQGYRSVFARIYRVADDQREFTISRAVGMRFAPLFPHNFSFAFSHNITGTLRKQEPLSHEPLLEFMRHRQN